METDLSTSAALHLIPLTPGEFIQWQLACQEYRVFRRMAGEVERDHKRLPQLRRNGMRKFAEYLSAMEAYIERNQSGKDSSV